MKSRLQILPLGILFILTTIIQVNAQLQVNCTTPISNTFFQQKLNQINATYDAASRFNQAKALAQSNCLSSWQVKQIAMSLYDDHDKLEFCKMAFVKTTDKDNFYDVYDAFAFFSSAFRLHDYVISMRGNNTVTTTITNVITTPNDIQFPVLPYPDYNQYLGPTGCMLPIDETSFMNYAREIKNSRISEQAKVEYAKSLISTQCLSTSQIMKIATLLTVENSKLDLLKFAIPRVYDRNNYSHAQHVLSSQPLKNDFLNALFGQPNNTNNQNTQTPCTVSDNDFNDIKKTISNTSFSSSKITIGKQAVQAKKCFTVKQIKELLGLYSFDDSKLEMAKFCYDYCIDKSNYYQINDVFSFTSSKDNLTEYIQGRQ